MKVGVGVRLRLGLATHTKLNKFGIFRIGVEHRCRLGSGSYLVWGWGLQLIPNTTLILGLMSFDLEFFE